MGKDSANPRKQGSSTALRIKKLPADSRKAMTRPAGSGMLVVQQNAAEPDEESIGIRQDVGARNPYALAELIYKRSEKCPLIWVEKDPEYNRYILQEILRCPYTALFDPVFGVSPLFASPLYLRIGIVADIVRLRDRTLSAQVIENIRNPRRFGPVNGSGSSLRLMQASIKSGSVDARRNEDASGNGNAGSVQTEKSPCTETGDHWGVYKIPGTNTPGYYCRRSTGYRSEIIHDVVQGCTKSCFFIAALASIAWCKSQTFPPNVDMTYYAGRVKDSYSFDFYTAQGVKSTKTVGADLVLNQAGTDTIFGRPSESYEVWHALYEKAFGLFKNLPSSPLDYDPAYGAYQRPDLPQLEGGNAISALKNITNAPYITYNPNNPNPNATYFQTKDITGQSFEKIAPVINWKDETQGVTRLPMVAWSYLSSAAADAAHPGTHITYGDEIIVANHSYSILGAVKNNGNNYIVLRNPWGRLWGADPGNAAFAQYLYTGAWYPAADFTCTLSAQDGIFALRADQFELYFMAFGWVNA